jgi:hypothetical protein
VHVFLCFSASFWSFRHSEHVAFRDVRKSIRKLDKIFNKIFRKFLSSASFMKSFVQTIAASPWGLKLEAWRFTLNCQNFLRVGLRPEHARISAISTGWKSRAIHIKDIDVLKAWCWIGVFPIIAHRRYRTCLDWSVEGLPWWRVCCIEGKVTGQV